MAMLEDKSLDGHGEFMGQRVVGRQSVVELRGELDILNIPGISDYLDVLTGGHQPHIVLDMREVSFLDASGLAMLVRARRRATERNGRLSIVIRDPAVSRVLRLAHLTGYFNLHDSVEAAVATAA
ncbi:STAS domain-containing protein [Streptomyces sp. NPDC047108]|uniref:STAS domain-containing protein n=1 Tax=Streptomyces sp. NPDC047108 TaxID=3155025 RepID=UPI00340D3DE4